MVSKKIKDMKEKFLKYLWGGTLQYNTLICLLEVLIHIPLYIVTYPHGHIVHSIGWTIGLIICIFLQIKKEKQNL